MTDLALSWIASVAIGVASTALAYFAFGTFGALLWLAGATASTQWALAWDRRSQRPMVWKESQR